MPRTKTSKLELEKLLDVMEIYYGKMISSRRYLDVWKEILGECQKNGVFLNQEPAFLYRNRWPGLKRRVYSKWRGKRKLNDVDRRIIAIAQLKVPNFCNDNPAPIPLPYEPLIKIEDDVDDSVNTDNFSVAHSSDEGDLNDSFDDAVEDIVKEELCESTSDVQEESGPSSQSTAMPPLALRPDLHPESQLPTLLGQPPAGYRWLWVPALVPESPTLPSSSTAS